MTSAVRVVVTNESAVAPGLWGARKRPSLGWLAELQGLMQAGAGKALKIGPLGEKQALNRKTQIQAKAKQAGVKVEFAWLDGYLYVRIAGGPKAAPADGTLDGEAKNEKLSEVIVGVIQGSRWWTRERIANVVLSMDRPAARRATEPGIGVLLDALVSCGQIQGRDEQGVTTYRAPRRQAN